MSQIQCLASDHIPVGKADEHLILLQLIAQTCLGPDYHEVGSTCKEVHYRGVAVDKGLVRQKRFCNCQVTSSVGSESCFVCMHAKHANCRGSGGMPPREITPSEIESKSILTYNDPVLRKSQNKH